MREPGGPVATQLGIDGIDELAPQKRILAQVYAERRCPHIGEASPDCAILGCPYHMAHELRNGDASRTDDEIADEVVSLPYLCMFDAIRSHTYRMDLNAPEAYDSESEEGQPTTGLTEEAMRERNYCLTEEAIGEAMRISRQAVQDVLRHALSHPIWNWEELACDLCEQHDPTGEMGRADMSDPEARKAVIEAIFIKVRNDMQTEREMGRQGMVWSRDERCWVPAVNGGGGRVDL
jgi:hypothetical protein